MPKPPPAAPTKATAARDQALAAALNDLRGNTFLGVTCWCPFSLKRLHFHGAEQLETFEEGLTHMGIADECPACDTREEHLVEGTRCRELQSRRDVLEPDGLYTGPLSPFELIDNELVLHNFPGEAAAAAARRAELEHIATGPSPQREQRERRLAVYNYLAEAPWRDIDGEEISRLASPSPPASAQSSTTEPLSTGSTAPAQAFGPPGNGTPWPGTAQPPGSPPTTQHASQPGRRRNLEFPTQAASAASGSTAASNAEPGSPQGYALAGLTLPVSSPPVDSPPAKRHRAGEYM